MKLLIPIFILIFSHIAHSSSITINDTSAIKGLVLNIPVYGDITEDFEYNDESNTFRIEFEFNALMLDIKGAVIDETTIVTDDNISSNVILNTNDFRKSRISVEFDANLNFRKGILFYLETEIFAGPDTLANITPNIFMLNNVIEESAFNEGIISIPEPVSEIDKSFLSTFYPNPFHRYAKADLTLTKPTNIKVATYSLTGADMLSDFCYEDCLEKHFRLSDEAGVVYFGDEQLPAGDYLLELRNDYSTLSSGAYLIVIQTDFKVLSQRFVVIK